MRRLLKHLIVGAMVPALAACSGASIGNSDLTPEPSVATSTTSSIARIDRTVRDLCKPLLEFFENELRLVNVKFGPEDNLNAPYGTFGSCSIVGRESQNGFAQVYEGGGQEASFLESVGFKRMGGYSADVWLLDKRPRRIEVSVRVGDWIGSLRIHAELAYTATGKLDITDKIVDDSVEFMIRITREIQQ
ncbi:protein of unknown function [Nocardia cyriacigeorgica GUH-2]|uniref:DUF3558 domain-containing protein n=1 Tax=Nocardia cyriacigeorgica (strain GUH-2) TaxID=1127134 RepID=H6R6A5_NOCCG|nr:protein of unknown function [Nocardia cyriacigeorgica GUH-2]